MLYFAFSLSILLFSKSSVFQINYLTKRKIEFLINFQIFAGFFYIIAKFFTVCECFHRQLV